MTTLKITKSQWDILKIKLTRKYNSLSEADLEYVEGEEEGLVERLAKRLNRTKEYVLFTLSKQLVDLDNGRL